MTQTKLQTMVLDGKEVAKSVLENVKNKITNIKQSGKRNPGLAVVLVGDNPASQTYVNSKEKKCKEIGMFSEVYKLPESTEEERLIELIKSLNNNNSIDGILVQLPLPKHINTEKVIEHISPEKDVDGLHPNNLGKLLCNEPCLKPCTPLGVLEIIKHYSIKTQGKHVVVIGRSTLVGKPAGLLLLGLNATVTFAHSKTQDIENITQTADILITAIGKPNLVKKNWVKDGVVIIDVGINRIIENNTSRLTGDVDYEDVYKKCSAITPVPGGVGPVTIAMLMSNTLEAYIHRT